MNIKTELDYKQKILSLEQEITNLKTAFQVMKLKYEKEKEDKTSEIPYDYYRDKVQCSSVYENCIFKSAEILT